MRLVGNCNYSCSIEDYKGGQGDCGADGDSIGISNSSSWIVNYVQVLFSLKLVGH